MNGNVSGARTVAAVAAKAIARVVPGEPERARLGALAAAALSALLLGLAGAGPSEAAFPGANGKIAFSTNRDGNYEIYVMNADGSGQKRLTNNPGHDDYPAWSPDGTKIAFSTDRDGNDEIYVMNADGSGQQRLTHHGSPDSYPAWSPDGARIAFASYRDGNWEIYVMNADGSAPLRLTNNSALDLAPAWSPLRPDGSTRIAYVSAREGGFEIWGMNVHGAGQRRLTNNASADPSWSPDGTRIAFTTSRNGSPEIYVVNGDGEDFGVASGLTNNAYDPAWSPDGARMAFASDRAGNSHIYVMNADGSSQRQLTNNSAFDHSPDWGPRVLRPVAPAALRAKSWSPTSIELRWRDRALNETRYELLRRMGRARKTTLTRLPRDQTRYVVRGLSAGTSYAYQLRACNSAGCSPFTPAVSARTATFPTATGSWQLKIDGGLTQTDHSDNMASNPDNHVINDDRQNYLVTMNISIRVTKNGLLQGAGTGKYRTASWSLMGTNGSHGAFRCSPKITAEPFRVSVAGHASRRSIHWLLSLTAKESNQSTYCGADYTAFGGTSTKIIESLKAVGGSDYTYSLSKHPTFDLRSSSSNMPNSDTQRNISNAWHITVTHSAHR